MNRIRSLLCNLGLHAWGKWEDEEPVVLIAKYVFSFSSQGLERWREQGFIRRRYCIHCGTHEIKKYTLDGKEMP